MDNTSDNYSPDSEYDGSDGRSSLFSSAEHFSQLEEIQRELRGICEQQSIIGAELDQLTESLSNQPDRLSEVERFLSELHERQSATTEEFRQCNLDVERGRESEILTRNWIYSFDDRVKQLFPGNSQGDPALLAEVGTESEAEPESRIESVEDERGDHPAVEESGGQDQPTSKQRRHDVRNSPKRDQGLSY
jgi:chromosome segregation ATPase